MPTENRSSNTETKIQDPEGRRERFLKWVLATKHPVLGYLDGTWLARGDDREGYADKYVQGLWVAFKEFAQPAPHTHADPAEVERLRVELAQSEAMSSMVEEHEWAEHTGTGPVSSKVEAAFTQLHNDLHECGDKLAEAQALLRDTKRYIERNDYPVFDLLKRIDAHLSASAESSAPAVSNLPELTDDLREILGRPNFTCHFIAKALRVMGHSIAPKSEDEQAVVIHWLLGHYLKNGSDWRLRAEAELKSASEKLAPSAARQQ